MNMVEILADSVENNKKVTVHLRNGVAISGRPVNSPDDEIILEQAGSKETHIRFDEIIAITVSRK